MKLQRKMTDIREIKIVPINSVKQWKNNPNPHGKDIPALAKLIAKHGQRTPIVVWTKNNTIYKGNGTHKAMQALGKEQITVTFVDFPSEEAATAYGISDNISGQRNEMDREILGKLMSVESFEPYRKFSGYTRDEIYGLLRYRNSEKEDDIPVVSKKPKTQLGDLYKLGDHRLLCGDSTKDKDVKKLMNSRKVDMVFTDPPYGVNIADKNKTLNKWRKANRITRSMVNDNISNYRKFYSDFFSLIPMADYNTCFITMIGQHLHNLRLAFEDSGFYWSDYLIWVKNNHVLGHKDYKLKHEFVLYGWKEKHKFYGEFGSTILEFDRPVKAKLHPIMKPVALIEKCLNDGSMENMIVYDGFGGSGSTLIACEKTRRKCYCMEIDPYYCDVAVQRWEDFSDKKAKLLCNTAS